MNYVTNINSYLDAFAIGYNISVERAVAIDAESVALEDVENAQAAVRRRNSADDRVWLREANTTYTRAEQVARSARCGGIASVGLVSFR